MDYTKGIPERLEALELLFERYPEWVGRFAFVQIGVPTRIELAEYRAVRDQTRELAQRINQRFPRAGGPTVHVIERNLDFFELVGIVLGAMSVPELPCFGGGAELG